MDSNPVENLIRPIVLNRKNALFAGHDESGKVWGPIASLIEMAKIHALELQTVKELNRPCVAPDYHKSLMDNIFQAMGKYGELSVAK